MVLLSSPESVNRKFVGNVVRRGVNWLELPDHIVSLVLNRLANIIDYIRFGAVCHSWNSISAENQRQYSPPPQLPLLVLSTNDDLHDQTRSVYSLLENRMLNMKWQIPQNKVCRPTGHGWLLMVDEKEATVCLFNPILPLNNEIKLPSLSDLDPADELAYYVYRAVLSADPASNPNFVLVVIYGRLSRLAFFKPRDSSWTRIVGSEEIYHENLLYTVDSEGTLYAWVENSFLSCVLPYPAKQFYANCSYYLVESGGDLLQVRREIISEENERVGFTTKFEVFKFDASSPKWLKVGSLCGQALFVGDNCPISISPLDFPQCKPNHIYYTDDYSEECSTSSAEEQYDAGVLNYEDGTIERFFPMGSKRKLRPSIWFEPMLYKCTV